ncbi:MAG: hypothetical protein PHF29_03280 [Candidatus Riflebacteria bacterium]|nr:hypothetical protein [Candidatus Riflebacteria bacterium]
MILFDVLSAYSALTAEQKRFVVNKKIQLNQLPKQTLDFIKPVGKFDMLLNVLRPKLKVLFTVLIILSFIGGFALAVYFDEPVIIFGAFGSAVFFALAFWGTFAFIKRYDLDDNLWHFTVPFINVLAQDMAEDEPIFVMGDFSTHEAKPHHKETINQNPGFMKYPKITYDIYMHKWLVIRAQLVNGACVDTQITANLKVRKKTDYSRSNKIKTKYKRKVKQITAVSIDFARKKFIVNSDFEAQKTINNNLKLKESDKKQRLTASRSIVCEKDNGMLMPEGPLNIIAKMMMNVSPAKKGK